MDRSQRRNIHLRLVLLADWSGDRRDQGESWHEGPNRPLRTRAARGFRFAWADAGGAQLWLRDNDSSAAGKEYVASREHRPRRPMEALFPARANEMTIS